MNYREAVEHYLPKKKSGEKSLADIRQEILQRHDFREEQVKEIIREISDRELEEISEKPKNHFAFLHHVGFSYFMVIANLAIIIYSTYLLTKMASPEFEHLGPRRFAGPLVFIGGAITMLGRNVIKIKKHRAQQNKS